MKGWKLGKQEGADVIDMENVLGLGREVSIWRGQVVRPERIRHESHKQGSGAMTPELREMTCIS